MFPTSRALKQPQVIIDPSPNFTVNIIFFNKYTVLFFLKTFATTFL